MLLETCIVKFNSLVTGRCACNFECVISKHTFMIGVVFLSKFPQLNEIWTC